MKVTTEHLSLIRDAIDATGLDTPEVRERYRRREIPRGDLVQDIDKRYRWDLFHAANRAPGRASLIDTLYGAGYHDGHLDTALRHVVEAL